MQLVQQIAFVLLSVAAVGLFTRNALRIRKNILLGKDEDFSDHAAGKIFCYWLSARKRCSGIHW